MFNYNQKIPFMYKTMNNQHCKDFIRYIVYEKKREICYFIYNTRVQKMFTPEIFARLVNIAFTEYPNLDIEVKYLYPTPSLEVQDTIRRIYYEKRKEVYEYHDRQRKENLERLCKGR